jgi:hypothetical protein
VLSAGAVLTVVAIDTSARGTVWVLERVADGARISITFAARVTEASLIGIGTAVMVTALSAGYVLSAAGHAIAFIPNEIGAALLHDERLTR